MNTAAATHNEPGVQPGHSDADPAVVPAAGLAGAADTVEVAEVPMRLGFARGVAPSKWERRWQAASPHRQLTTVPLALTFGRSPERENDRATTALVAECDVVIERCAPAAKPTVAGRHALRLYEEAIAVVVSVDHDLAKQESIGIDELDLVTLLDHPHHPQEWPAPQRWDDPSWMPATTLAALQLVATNAGAIMLPLPLARHLSTKREHAVLPLRSAEGTAPDLPGSTVWATWSIDRDDEEIQQLVGVLRGRTARSSRLGAPGSPEQAALDQAAAERKAKATQQAKDRQAAKRSQKLKPNSRGAQLAASREKAERKKAEQRQAKRRKRR